MTTATLSKERPILFSGPMVRAILEGRKTQTRRIVKGPYSDWEKFRFTGAFESDGERVFQFDTRNVFHQMLCPYGDSGDRLWVRETFAIDADTNFYYRADGKPAPWDGMQWKPSIHMPRKVSRITLEIESVRVERLNDITGDDARAEGCPDDYKQGAEKASMDFMSAGWFAELWESINGDGSWASNPWVWVIEFNPIHKEM